jgi:hypothetical protein
MFRFREWLAGSAKPAERSRERSERDYLRGRVAALEARLEEMRREHTADLRAASGRFAEMAGARSPYDISRPTNPPDEDQIVAPYDIDGQREQERETRYQKRCEAAVKLGYTSVDALESDIRDGVFHSTEEALERAGISY